VHDRGQEARCRGIEEDRAHRESERCGVDDAQVVAEDGKGDGNGGAAQVGHNHDSPSGMAIHDGPGNEAQQQHRRDLEDHGAGHPQSRPGKAEDQDHQGDCVEGVAPPRDRLRGEQSPERRRPERSPPL
jgi:hypothetical protein